MENIPPVSYKRNEIGGIVSIKWKMMKELKDKQKEKMQNRDFAWKRWLTSLFTEGESSENEENNGLKNFVGSLNIDGRWFFHQIPFFLTILGGILLMVTNRYQAQQEIIEKEQLQEKVEDWRFRSLTRSSELTTQTRQSQIEERLRQLGDSLLKAPTEPPFTINPNN